MFEVALLWTYLVSFLLPLNEKPEIAFNHTKFRRNRFQLPINHSIKIHGDQFLLDGRPLHIMSGSVHYFRLPSEYWRDRLQKLKAAGLNTVATFVAWNFHETEERQYSFEGSRNVVQFLDIAHDLDLYVLLRVGPYIGAERDLGGLPYWLIGKYPHIVLRSLDKDFMRESKIWMDKLFEKLGYLLYGNGGPIILVQVENEYGSYSYDTLYMEQMYDVIHSHVGDKAILFTSDEGQIQSVIGGSVPGALTTVNVDSGGSKNEFRILRQFMPKGPLMTSQLYINRITYWGGTLHNQNLDAIIKTMKDIIENQFHFNIYTFYGGTNFEFGAGATYLRENNNYYPVMTSCGYDSPLNEAGDPTPLYFAIRKAMEKHNPTLNKQPLAKASKKGKYGKVSLDNQIELLSAKGRRSFGKKYKDVKGDELPTFEQLRQRAGLVLYETVLPTAGGLLTIKGPKDCIYVFVDGVSQGVISQMKRIYSLYLFAKPQSVLSLLVETHGHIHSGIRIHDYKGIAGKVEYSSRILNGSWTITGFPLEKLNSNDDTPNTSSDNNHGPVLYGGRFKLDEQTPLDTYLDTSKLTKGYIWINGHNLGRYWPALGPQITLYVPGVWLKLAPEYNNIQILELENEIKNVTVEFIDHPILSGNNDQAVVKSVITMIGLGILITGVIMISNCLIGRTS